MEYFILGNLGNGILIEFGLDAFKIRLLYAFQMFYFTHMISEAAG